MKYPSSMKGARIIGIILIFVALAAGAYLLGSMGEPETAEQSAPRVTASAATAELIPGKNRLVIGLVGEDNEPLVKADVDLDISRVDGTGKRVLAKAGFIAGEFAGRGAYVANVSFSDPGEWQADVTVQSKEGKSETRIDLPVVASGTTPAIGEQVPKSQTPTASKLADLKKICSADPPCTMHDHSIDKSLAAHRPTLVLFAAPGQCQSLLCGPQHVVVENAKKLYKDDVDFIHVEIYSSDTGKPVQTVIDWGLQNEPWTFIIDSGGKVSAKFEGPVSLDELKKALDKVTAG